MALNIVYRYSIKRITVGGLQWITKPFLPLAPIDCAVGRNLVFQVLDGKIIGTLPVKNGIWKRRPNSVIEE